MLDVLTSMCKTSAQLRLENLALRQQLTVLRRSAPKRLKLTRADRIFWVWLRRVWGGDWKSVSLLKSRTALQLENIALRHQIGVLQRSAKKRLQLHNSDR